MIEPEQPRCVIGEPKSEQHGSDSDDERLEANAADGCEVSTGSGSWGSGVGGSGGVEAAPLDAAAGGGVSVTWGTGAVPSATCCASSSRSTPAHVARTVSRSVFEFRALASADERTSFGGMRLDAAASSTK